MKNFPFAPVQSMKTILDTNRSTFYQSMPAQSFEPRSQDGVPRAFCVTFCTPQKVTSRLPVQRVPKFCKLHINTHNSIKEKR